jgi:hypothetical protein
MIKTLGTVLIQLGLASILVLVAWLVWAWRQYVIGIMPFTPAQPGGLAAFGILSLALGVWLMRRDADTE